MITATYLRYSSDQQRASSIRDQLRNVERYCERMGWPAPKVFADEAVSGSVVARAGYQAMLAAAQAGEFSALLVDDLSRLARDMTETPRTVKLLKYWGVRVIGVSDGVDTERKGYKVDVGLRGLMSELYLDDLAEKTHRGLMGQALAGYSAGGLPYGYRSTRSDAGSRREIYPEQARWVMHIFERYAAGATPREIAGDLNARGVPSPRGSTWAMSAIYGDRRGLGILNNCCYIGQQIWNRSKWVKDPRTGRRSRFERPPEEWVIHEDERLRIIPQDLWSAAKQRQQETWARSRRSANRSSKAGRGPKYLFSGLLVCGECGGRYVVVDRYRYGCATHKDRGASACSNSAKVARSVVEDVLLAGIKDELLSEAGFREFEAAAREALREIHSLPDAARQALTAAERERDNILAAIRQGIITPSTKAALEDAEGRVAQARAQVDQAEAMRPEHILPRARAMHRSLTERLEQIDDVPAAREAIREITGEIRLIRDGSMLFAELQGGHSALCQIRVVAGAGFEPATFGL